MSLAKFCIVENSGTDSEYIATRPLTFKEVWQYWDRWYTEEDIERLSVRIARIHSDGTLSYDW